MTNSHMKTGPLVAVDKEIDNVEDVQGRPGEEEDHAHAHQNPDDKYYHRHRSRSSTLS